MWTTLIAPTGWTLVGKVGAVCLAITGVGLTWGTFQESVRNEDYRRVEESYERFLEDLGGDNEALRADAISRIPELALRRVYVTDASHRALLDLVPGIGSAPTPLFLPRVRRAIISHFAGRSDGDALVTAREVDELIRALVRIGKEGWIDGYEMAPLENPARDLSWIWQPNPQRTRDDAADIFREVGIRGMKLTDYSLRGASFSGSRLEHCDFSRSDLNHASFADAYLDECTLHNVQLRRVDWRSIKVSNSRLSGCSMQSAQLSEATFTNSYLNGLDLSPLILPNVPDVVPADVSRAVFEDCSMSDMNAPGANFAGVVFRRAADASPWEPFGLTNSILSGTDLRGAHLDNLNLSSTMLSHARLNGASARGAVFHFADITNAVLDGADLSGADFTDVIGISIEQLSSGRGLSSCRGANIYGVRGVSPQQRRLLLSMGAIERDKDRGLSGTAAQGHAQFN